MFELDITSIKDFVRILFICLFSYFAYFKATNNRINIKNKNIIIVAIGASIVSIFYVWMNIYINAILAFLITIFVYMIMLRKIIKGKISLFIVGYIFSIVIVYLSYFIATLIIGFALVCLMPNITPQSIWFVVPIVGIAVFLFYGVFKIKRFKNGFNFLKNENINKRLAIATCIVFGVIVILFAFFERENNRLQQNLIFIGSLIIIATIYEVIRKLITEHYKKHMRDRTIEMQKREIDEHLDTLEHVKAENIRLASIIHKYNSRISALERSVTQAMSNMNTEFAGELSVMLDETKSLAGELEEQTKRNVNVPSTGIYGIDNMFKFMYDECINNDINFSLKITDNINYLVENVVKKEKLETLIGDHIKDAIIAINSGSPEYKSILCILGIVRDSYEFSVYDTGIDFEIDTLLKLGVEQVTTHKDNGGSGIGFMTTFETMKECGASLVIEEYDKKTTHYTKSVTIRFDGKNEYRIYSYRHKEIKKASKDKRISINNMTQSQ